MHPAHQDTPVLIVGAGPVGLALAIELGMRGIRSLVVERHRELQRIPKGQNLTQRSVEHFRRWGIETQLRAAKTTPDGYRPAGMVGYGEVTGKYRYPWLQRDQVEQYYATSNARIPQYATEQVLRDRAAKIPEIELRFGWTAETARQTLEAVEIDVLCDDRARKTVCATWVIACDGSGSRIRDAAGITQTRTDHDRLMALLVFRSAEFDRIVAETARADFMSIIHRDLDGYWQFFGRIDANESWFFHAPVKQGVTTETLDIRALLTRAVGREFEFSVEHLGFWDLRFALADTYRAGRILIAGDAAHSHPPYGGYGINNGFEDAVNLGWKLAAQIEGWAGPGLLDSYDAERRPVFASTRDEFIDRAIREDRAFLAAHDPQRDRADFEEAWHARATGAVGDVHAYAPNYVGSPVILNTTGTPGARADHQHRARAGHHLSPGTTDAGAPAFDVLGRGFTLLLSADADPEPFKIAAKELNIPLETLILSPGSASAYEAPAVLARPDQYVAWAGELTGVDAYDVLCTASGRPM